MLERATIGLEPGAVCDVICTDGEQSRDPSLVELSSAPCLSVAAVDRLIEQQQEAVRAHVPSIMREKNEAHAREAAAWRPPETLTRWHVRIA